MRYKLQKLTLKSHSYNESLNSTETSACSSIKDYMDEVTSGRESFDIPFEMEEEFRETMMITLMT